MKRSFVITLATALLLGGLPPHIAASENPSQIQTSRATGERLRVLQGRSLVVNTPRALKRVSVSDPAIATALVLSATQVLIHGLAAGSATLLLWDQNDNVEAFDLDVELNVPGLRQMLERVFPEEAIEVKQSGASLVLSGGVSSEEVLEKAALLAATHSGQVVNLLAVNERNETILLQVRFAEVNRAALRELGLTIISTGGANTIGSVTTQQFAPVQGNLGAVPAETEGGEDPGTASIVSGGIGNPLKGQPAVFGLNDLLNVFIFRPDINLGAAVRALQQKNLLQILAEPNVLTRNGQEASFLAGGEFPFPVVQAGAAANAVTIQFKEFGVRLKFTPNLRRDGTILLKVAPEVSALDFANSLTLAGFLIPAISTRRADTEVVLEDGQSFAIAGLIDDRTIRTASKVPLLGDIPVIGKLFRSQAIDRSKTELLVMVTPRVVAPGEPSGLTEPLFPDPLLDPDQFDGKEPKSSGDQPGGGN